MRQQMEQLKQSDQAETTEQLTALAGLAAPSLLALGLRTAGAMAREFPQRSITTVTTNVPGPQYPLYAAGRQMVAYLPFVPLAQGVRIGVAIMSYNGGVSFGATGDYDTVPDLDRFCRSIETGISDLRDRARRAARRKSTSRSADQHAIRPAKTPPPNARQREPRSATHRTIEATQPAHVTRAQFRTSRTSMPRRQHG